jgi:hypothetical protein
VINKSAVVHFRQHSKNKYELLVKVETTALQAPVGSINTITAPKIHDNAIIILKIEYGIF